jgi:carbon monoxide dehydrogenase subunit G
MKMTGERLLPVTPRQAWDALNDPAMLKDCIPGCESVTMIEPLHYELVMAAKVGPVSARFKGRLTQSDVVEPESYTIQFDGQGGAAGFGKGTAAVRLSPAEGGTRLDYDVTAQIGGKLAQIGSRLVDASARQLADDFFVWVAAEVAQPAGGATAAASGADAVLPDGSAGSAAAGTVEASTPGRSDDGAAPAATPAGPAAPGGGSRTRWIVAAIVVAALLAWWLA